MDDKKYKNLALLHLPKEWGTASSLGVSMFRIFVCQTEL